MAIKVVEEETYTLLSNDCPALPRFELGWQARPGRQTGMRLFRPVSPDGQNKSWGHRLSAKAITYLGRHLYNK
jgi:hypothetical protein